MWERDQILIGNLQHPSGHSSPYDDKQGRLMSDPWVLIETTVVEKEQNEKTDGTDDKYIWVEV